MDLTKEECNELINYSDLLIESCNKDLLKEYEIIKSLDKNATLSPDMVLKTTLGDDSYHKSLFDELLKGLNELKEKKDGYLKSMDRCIK